MKAPEPILAVRTADGGWLSVGVLLGQLRSLADAVERREHAWRARYDALKAGRPADHNAAAEATDKLVFEADVTVRLARELGLLG
jgi:hypothetical protein